MFFFLSLPLSACPRRARESRDRPKVRLNKQIDFFFNSIILKQAVAVQMKHEKSTSKNDKVKVT